VTPTAKPTPAATAAQPAAARSEPRPSDAPRELPASALLPMSNVNATPPPTAAPAPAVARADAPAVTVEPRQGKRKFELVSNPVAEAAGDVDNDLPGEIDPTPIDNIRLSVAGNTSRLAISVPGGARYSVVRRGARSTLITIWDTTIYDLALLRSIEGRNLGGAIKLVTPEVEGSMRSYVNLVVEHRQGATVRSGEDRDTLWLTFE